MAITVNINVRSFRSGIGTALRASRTQVTP
jgi:hypothetical protein